MQMCRRAAISRRAFLLGILIAADVFLASCGSSTAPAAVAAAPVLRTDCEAQVVPASFPSSDDLWHLEAQQAGYGMRSTASPQHQAYINWLQQQIQSLPGMSVQSIPYQMSRWTELSTSLEAGPNGTPSSSVPVSGPVPYAAPTSAAPGSGPMLYVPASQSISQVDVSGKIVLRDITASSVPNIEAMALSWWVYDPDLSLTTHPTEGALEAENLGGVNTDMQQAQDGGAIGAIFMHNLPRAQVAEQYAPYQGTHWQIPALEVGADEAQQLKAWAAQGGAATLHIAATVEPATTNMLVATLPGTSDERIIITSHTDGMNALWDNGPLAMLEMARYFSVFDSKCRPRTLQFVFTTAHLYQVISSAAREAEQLDFDYDKGTVAAIVVIEHLGAYRPVEVARTDGGPGEQLQITSEHEANLFFVSESPALQATLQNVVSRQKLARTFALQGAGLPSPTHIPPQTDFGGEGSDYQSHLLPTIAFITSPYYLFTPRPDLSILDQDFLYQQTLVFADLVDALAPVSRDLLEGGFSAERALRESLCATGQDVSAIVTCAGTPADPGSVSGSAAQAPPLMLPLVPFSMLSHQ